MMHHLERLHGGFGVILRNSAKELFALWHHNMEELVLNTPAINRNHIEAMLAKLKEVSSHAHEPLGVGAARPAQVSGPKFGDVLQSSLEQVSGLQNRAERLGHAFARGDNSVAISDMMIAGQKASLAFQATVQVRNKLVSAYQDIMSMPV